MSDDIGKRMEELSAEAVEEGLPDDGMMDIEAAPVGPQVALDILARRLPKASLHLHFSGSIRPSTLRLMAHEHGADFGHRTAGPDALYDYRGFVKFIQDMQRSASLMRDVESTRRLALDVLGAEVDGGARHVEMMVTLGYYLDHGAEAYEFLGAIDSAFETATEAWDLSGGVIVEFDRGSGGDRAREIAEIAVEAKSRGMRVVGVGNDGDPLAVPFAALAPGYDVARDAGLKLCGHVDLPDDVAPALDMGLDRLDHGYAVLYDPELLERVVTSQVPFTICPTSNILQMPGLTPDFDSHALGGLMEAGVNVTIHGDDPPMFYTDLAQEYRAATRTVGWGPEELVATARRSLDAAWLDDDDRRARWNAEIDALLTDPRWRLGADV